MCHLSVTFPYTLASSETVLVLSFYPASGCSASFTPKAKPCLAKDHNHGYLPELAPQLTAARAPSLYSVGFLYCCELVFPAIWVPLWPFCLVIWSLLLKVSSPLELHPCCCFQILEERAHPKHLILLLQAFLIFSAFILLYHPLDSWIDRDTGIQLTLIPVKGKEHLSQKIGVRR